MTTPPAEEPIVLPRAEHSVSRKDIGDNALKVLYRLHGAGFKAYLVGGSVRDLLLGRRPKDFDVSTDARPGQIRRLFRNCRIIGRRFRLAHVFFQEEIIEVATFRRDPDPEAQESGPGDLLITDDNVFGTPREDAFRRDFTINALFYDIGEFAVLDYVGGIADLRQRVIRTIGDADVRFREDPVRMLRACELAGRLDFTIDPASQEAIGRHRHEIEKAAPARLTEEILQLLRCGAAGAAMQWMLELGVLDELLPEAKAMLTAGRRGLGEFERVLPRIDRMVRDGRELSDAALLASFLLPAVLLRRHELEAGRHRPLSHGALRRLIVETTEGFFARFTVARQKTEEAVEALLAFHRLGEADWNPIERARFARRPAFRNALVLFEILVDATGQGREVLDHWRLLAASAPEFPTPGPPRRRRRRRGNRGRAAAGARPA